MEKAIYFATGCYTEKVAHVPGACGEGIGILSFNEENGRIKKVSLTGDLNNPTYLNWNRKKQYLYAVTERSEDGGEVCTFSLNNFKALHLVGKQPGPGRSACHVSGDPEKNMLFAASYSDGCMKAYKLIDGVPDKAFHDFSYSGRGPNTSRQSEPHAHQVLFGPDKKYLYVCDLGSDTIWKHDLSESSLNGSTALKVPGGYGPRHLAFDTDGQYAFILCELVPQLLVAEIDQKTGNLNILQDLPTVDSSYKEISAPAAIKVHPSGKTLVVSNRFDDSITVFRIIREKVKVHLEEVENFSTRGKTPRDMTFSPSGEWLLIANQDSNDIQVKAFDPGEGMTLDKWAEPFETGSPVCLVVLD
ncbi:MAG: lactonase family protein [Spirochaetaceae bacterium]|nr:lactonase family protein [Spirochaetaceae bacterium]